MRKVRSHAVRRFCAVLFLAGGAGGALAEGAQDRYWGRLEYFFPTISSTARLDFPNTDVPGTELSLEDDLDLTDRKGTPYLLLGTRLGEKWRMEFEYYRLNRTGTKTTQREIDWGDTHFDVGAELKSTFDTSVYRLTGGYSFYRSAQAEMGAAIGLHMTKFDMSLSGTGTGPSGLGFQTEGRDKLVPLPTLGLHGNYAFNDQWRVNGRVDWLSLSYEEYDGSLVNFMGAVEWRFMKNWGVGGGYRLVDYKLEAGKEKFNGEINYRFRGPTLYLEAAF